MRYAAVIDQAGITMEDYQKVIAVLGTEPPAGRLAHAVGVSGDGLRFVNIWETREHASKFERERLLPAFAQVFGDRPPTRPQVSELDVADYIGAS